MTPGQRDALTQARRTAKATHNTLDGLAAISEGDDRRRVERIRRRAWVLCEEIREELSLRSAAQIARDAPGGVLP